MPIKFSMRSVFIMIVMFCYLIVFSACAKDPAPKHQNNIFTNKRIKSNVHLNNENVGGMSSEEAEKKIKDLATKINVESKDAIVEQKTWAIRLETIGKQVDVGKTLEKLLQAKHGDKVELVINEKIPTVRGSDLSNNIVKLSEFSTPLLDKSQSRIKNIKLACNVVNNTIIQPGETFSFNDKLGKRTHEKGYEEAPIVVKTPNGSKKENGVGGGICQLSSTISNAAEEAGIQLLEKHVHSKGVGYVAKGEDATVTYGGADLKLKNNKKHPIMFKVQLNSKTLSVKILENKK